MMPSYHISYSSGGCPHVGRNSEDLWSHHKKLAHILKSFSQFSWNNSQWTEHLKLMFSAFHMSWTSLPLSSQDLWQSVEGRGEDGRPPLWISQLLKCLSEVRSAKQCYFFLHFDLLQNFTDELIRLDNQRSEEREDAKSVHINETVIDAMEPANVTRQKVPIVLNSVWHKKN